MARPGMISVLVGVLSVVVFFANGVSPNPAAQDPPPNFRVAFFGDSWTESESPELFRMLKEEGADMIVHAGDFTYSPDKTLIFRVVENTMGPNFPFVAVLGNHDLDEPHRGNQHSADPVSGYQPLLLEQTAKANVKCDEDPRGGAGAMQACYHQGLLVVNLSYRLKLDFWRGISATDYAKFIDDTFDANPNVRWRYGAVTSPHRFA
ncbi:MAG: hypothetical protein BJ554DRAFT_457 [Olpidium bornovanus]|uniref:Calcineurin-like phosphoesterase domain-containing protein n=1 Tax=Olpidium bornovanus TaxID=278681 RepID=A0A8H8DHT8_9FUNG|nr:MAG: hypothetical protein BJ554DRAFT_457 [Olpidium bornovanus]